MAILPSDCSDAGRLLDSKALPANRCLRPARIPPEGCRRRANGVKAQPKPEMGGAHAVPSRRQALMRLAAEVATDATT